MQYPRSKFRWVKRVKLEELEQQKLIDRKKQEAGEAIAPLLKHLRSERVERITIKYSGANDNGSINEIEIIPHSFRSLCGKEENILKNYVLTHLPEDWKWLYGSKGSYVFDLVWGTSSGEHYWLAPTHDENALPKTKWKLSE
ncbi:hypothetical protein [Myxosarcina sp. GI1]|uniref:hypothetical protein n=1 Tax=Myxosarcina sp. GI1 TaxID=1541065 RepID=UPI000561EB94|nr:hypothetical protein [Myxosarcina sp. GI1]